MQQSLSLTDFIDGRDDTTVFERFDNKRIRDLCDYKESADRLTEVTGTSMRNILREDKEPIDMALAAFDAICRRLGITREDIGALVLAGSFIDPKKAQQIAEEVAHRRNLHAKVIGFSHGCTGFVAATGVACAQVQNIARGKHCMILNVEALSRIIDAGDRFAAPIFGDGYAGTTVWRGPGHRIHYSTNAHVIPPKPPVLGRKIFSVVHEDVKDHYGKDAKRWIVRMQGNDAYDNGKAIIESGFLDLYYAFRNSMRRIICVPHNPNATIVTSLGEYYGDHEDNDENPMDVDFVNGMQGVANTSSCTIPMTFAHLNTVMQANKETILREAWRKYLRKTLRKQHRGNPENLATAIAEGVRKFDVYTAEENLLRENELKRKWNEPVQPGDLILSPTAAMSLKGRYDSKDNPITEFRECMAQGWQVMEWNPGAWKE